MTTITTPLGLLEERGDYLRLSSWESEDCKTWVHILRWTLAEPGNPECAVVSRDDEPLRVVQLGSGWGDFASDVDVLRHVFKELGIKGPIHEWTVLEGGE